ncbi:MAG: chromosome segregation protein SMC [Myxococcales bacterium]|nr:chromosome segregation protein SMC [Myxococcales bacterium]
MRIKRLDIAGFKSFMDRAVFTFGDGVTGVVGPNGCGKSNVVDAIRWVMGEQSAKNLRGRGMEDVIFNGSESKPPLSMAEVTLTMAIDEGDPLAPQYASLAEVSVTRRLFRSGESEYLINKAPCRLLDITELFLGTGVGTKAYSIVEQGRVGLIVSAKPEERRAFIEEAAGVTKYKARRKAAERKMDYTQQNLLRVTDIVSELGKRLESLQRQARKAEKYKRLRSEAREIELHSASVRFLELIAEQKVLEARLESLSSEEHQALSQVRQMEDSIQSKRQHLEADSAELETLAGQVLGLEGQIQLDEQALAHAQEDQSGTEKRLEDLQAEALQLTETDAVLESGLREREQALTELQGAWKENDVAVEVKQEEQRRVGVLQGDLARRLDEERDRLVEIAGKLANQESNLVNLGRRKAELEARRAKRRAEAEVLGREAAGLACARDELASRIDDLRRHAVELAEKKGSEEQSLTRTREAFAESEVRVICLREELADRRSRLASLQEIQRNYEGCDRGVRAVMRRGPEGTAGPGVLGLVADLLSAPPEYERAIEAALGERLQHVVVEDRQKALELVEYLRASSEGRSSFLPRLPEAQLPAAEPNPVLPFALAHALSVVSCDDAFLPLVRSLLGEVVIVRDLAAAREHAEAGPRGLTLVTLDGEVLRADGSITGGVMEGPAVGALQKKREISELAAEVARVEEQYSEQVTRHYSLQKEMGRSEGVLKGLAKHQHEKELDLASLQKDLHKAAEDLSRLREWAAVLDREDRQLSEELSGLAAEEEAARGELTFGQTDRDRREEGVRLLLSEAETLKVRTEALGSELTALRVKLAASTEKAESARQEIDRLASQRAEVAGRLARGATLISQDEARAIELGRRIEETTRARAERSSSLESLRGSLESRRAAHAELSAEVRAADAGLRELRGRLDELSQGLSELSVRQRELALEVEHLHAQVTDRLQTTLGEELHRFHLLPRPSPSAESRLKELKAQIERMGEINLTAIEEHSQLSERHQFLSGQKKDLEASLEKLKHAIVKIDRTSRERFKHTFEVVNEKFQQVFPRLFGGGRAGLVLTQEAPGMEAGVEIVAQPPGKKLQSVSLLSGGEKALTAVSLVFAIFLIKPSPFCLLDEVDAPLDEANVGRYNELVREMAGQSQFILITHSKKTMEVVDTLYGVTMEEPGISKLVSVRMREAVAANDNQAA